MAFTLAAYGGGSMLAAFVLPRLLDRIADRTIMLASAGALTSVLTVLALLTGDLRGHAEYWPLLLGGWFLLGIAYSMSITPSGRLLRRSAGPSDRPAIFAAQFALSHACWLIAYPLAGQLGAGWSQQAAFGVLGGLAATGLAAALFAWPAHDPDQLPHNHTELEPDHPHYREHIDKSGIHTHDFVIDDLHLVWPGRL